MKSKPDLPNIDIEDTNMNATDSFVHAVEAFECNTTDPLSEDLENFLKHVAKTGDILGPWEKVQNVFIHKMKLVLDDFFNTNPYKEGKVNPNCENDKFEDMRERVCQLAAEFESPPFTFQRLCELVTNPKKNYTKCEKFIRAMEKNLMVVSPWSYASRRSNDNTEQVNGGFNMRPAFTTTERPWSNLPPSPITTSAPTLPDISSTSKPEADAEASAESQAGDSKTAEDESVSVVDESAKKDDALPAEDRMETDASPEKGSEEVVTDQATATSESATSACELQSSAPTETAESGETVKLPEVIVTPESLPEEKIDPLPSVGTLVEKHNASRASTTDEETKLDQNTTDVVQPLPEIKVATPNDPVFAHAQDDVVAARSPKRKLSSDEITPMDVGSPTKRPKQDEDGDDELEAATNKES